jgi:hypothetical protein
VARSGNQSGDRSIRWEYVLAERGADVPGHPTVNVGGKGCGELIAGSIALNGNATLDNAGCSTAAQPTSQCVKWCTDEEAR